MSLKTYINSRMQHAKAMQRFRNQFDQFTKMDLSKRFMLNWVDRLPCLDEATVETKFDAHYIYHPAWAARILAQTNPTLHTDISGSLSFCTIASAFMKVQFFDYRPAKITLDGLTTDKADILNLPFKDGSIESISCMHVVEHIGLGRYGDALDPDGDLKAIAELKRVTRSGGTLLFVVPIGRIAKVVYNAHRIYTYRQIVDLFDGFEVRNFSLITDRGVFNPHSNENEAGMQKYGCGCWCFQKK